MHMVAPRSREGRGEAGPRGGGLGRAGPGRARPLPPREVAGGGKAGGRGGRMSRPYSRARPHAEWRGCSHAWLHLSRGNSSTCARPRSGRGNPNLKDASGKLAREGEREHPAPLPRRRFQLGVPPATSGSQGGAQVGAPGGAALGSSRCHPWGSQPPLGRAFPSADVPFLEPPLTAASGRGPEAGAAETGQRGPARAESARTCGMLFVAKLRRGGESV